MYIKEYWDAVIKQDAAKIKSYFCEDAYINWHNTNEHFTLEEFLIANCEYPGKWQGNIERTIEIDNMIITVVRVFSKNENLSFHVTSFIELKEEKIASIDEYWGDDSEPPLWRLQKKIGTKIE